MFGPTAAYGFYVRHAAGVAFDNVALHVAREDLRPAFVLDDVTGAKFADVDVDESPGVPPLAATRHGRRDGPRLPRRDDAAGRPAVTAGRPGGRVHLIGFT